MKLKLISAVILSSLMFIGSAEARTGGAGLDILIGNTGGDRLASGSTQTFAGQTIRIRIATTNNQGTLIFLPGLPVVLEIG